MRMLSTFYSSVLESKWTCVYSDRQMIISKRFSKIYGFRGLPDRCRVTHKIKLLKKHTAHLLITYGYFICTSQQWQYCYRISLSFYCRVVPLAWSKVWWLKLWEIFAKAGHGPGHGSPLLCPSKEKCVQNCWAKKATQQGDPSRIPTPKSL